MPRPEKYNEKFINEVAKYIATGKTLDDASKDMKFNYFSFHKSLQQDPEKRLLFETAKLQSLESLTKIAEEGLQKLLNGFTEEKIVKKYKIIEKDGIPTKRLVSETTEKIFFPPSATMIQFHINREEKQRAKLNPTETVTDQPIIFNETKTYETSEAKDE